MKLLFIVNEPWFFISHRLPIALAAKEQGYSVHIATRSGEAVADIKQLGFVHHEITLSRSGNSVFEELSSLFSIWKLLRKLKPNIIHLVTIKPVLYGGIAARFTSVSKVVAAVSGLGTLFIAKGFKADLKRNVGALLYKLALRSSKVTVILQNPDDQNLLLKLGAVKLEQTVLIRGSGVDLNGYQFFEENLTEKPTVTFAARLLFDKGLAEFIEAVKILNGRGIEATYQIVGDLDPGNPTSATAENLITWRSIPNLSIVGYQKDMASVFKNSNLVVLPSYREGLPKVLIEAAACGRAVITTDVPGCRDAIENNVTGLLVPVKNAQALAQAMERLIQNTEQRKEMGAAGRQLAEKEFSINLVVNKHLEIYKS